MVQETKENPRSQDTPPEVGQSSEEEVTPKTYSEAEYLKAVSDEKTISGRLKTDLGEAVKERDTFKSQAEQAKREAEEATAALEETREHIANLKSDIETLEEGDEDPVKLSRLRRELRDATINVKQGVKAEQDALDELTKTATAEREQFAGMVAEAQAGKFEVDVFEIAEEYVDESGKDIKPERLKALCEKAGQAKREDIQALADVLWTKKGKEKGPALVGDSGVTSGGGTGIPTKMAQFKIWINTLSQKEYEKVAPEVNKMMREGKIK